MPDASIFCEACSLQPHLLTSFARLLSSVTSPQRLTQHCAVHSVMLRCLQKRTLGNLGGARAFGSAPLRWDAHVHHNIVKPEHCDVYGHVNNAHYLTLFEDARWDLITANEYGLDKIKACGIGPVILEAHVKYLSELREGEAIVVETVGLTYEGKVGTLQQVMKSEATGKVSSEAVFTFGLFDLKARKLVQPTAEWEKGIGLVR
jgi:thioesterase-3